MFGSVPLAVAQGVADLRAMQRQVIEAPDGLGIPALAHEECLTGFTTLGATVYPTPLAWGATFDPELIAEMSRCHRAGPAGRGNPPGAVAGAGRHP